MAGRVWDPFLTEQDKAHLAASAPKGRYGFGDRAAVLSVDNYRKAVGDRPEPLLDAITTWPGSTGLAGWAALDQTVTLLAEARAAGLPTRPLRCRARWCCARRGRAPSSARRSPRT